MGGSYLCGRAVLSGGSLAAGLFARNPSRGAKRIRTYAWVHSHSPCDDGAGDASMRVCACTVCRCMHLVSFF